MVLLIAYMSSCSKKEEFNGVLYDKPAENFCLTGWSGSEKELCLGDFKGKVILLFFGYTRCPDVCPQSLQVLSEAFNELTPEERKMVRVIFVSLDSERDTPEYTQRYVEFFNENFIGLAGSREELRRISKSYKIFFKKVDITPHGGYLIDHTALIYLIDKGGKLKLLYPVTRQKPQLITQDIKRLL
ncbi:SCO family protein [Hydrogenivirga caldilitoris]|uniref:SCO family protein n=1 Tax=Hydrogenivirga caldilitoris TaxID=246264 RepID=UPI001FE63509|nr:SCO family protein [Hydrogenivirga caldilitoris]